MHIEVNYWLKETVMEIEIFSKNCILVKGKSHLENWPKHGIIQQIIMYIANPKARPG